MKKLLLFSLFAFVSFSIHGKKVYMNARIVEPLCNSDEYANDSIAIRVSPFRELFAFVSIQNKLDERIYVEWSNFRWDGSQIAFDSDSRLFMDQPKQDEAIMAGENTDKYIVLKELIGSNWITPWYHEKDFKKGGTQTSVMIVPVRFSSGKIKDYKIKFEIFNSEL
mgnify:FL=1